MNENNSTNYKKYWKPTKVYEWENLNYTVRKTDAAIATAAAAAAAFTGKNMK